MKLRKHGLERRTVIETYAKYDCGKKGRELPDLSTWDWLHADSIDEKLGSSGMKCGVLSGYLFWDVVELNLV
jgi:hypothetical protein